MPAVLVRALLPSDEPAWRELWRGYCAFHGRELPEEVTRRTWKRILDPDSAVMCLVADGDGGVQGFAHCVVHEATWDTQPVCFVEDFFVAPQARGRGVGTALFEWLRSAMPAEGWARVYWHVPADDAAAVRLCDRFAAGHPSVGYQIRGRS